MKNLGQIKAKIATEINQATEYAKDADSREAIHFTFAINYARKNNLLKEADEIKKAIENYQNFQDSLEKETSIQTIPIREILKDTLKKTGKIRACDYLKGRIKFPEYKEMVKKDCGIPSLIDEENQIDRSNLIYYTNRISTRN